LALNNKVTLIGGGLAGSLLSIYLAKKGFVVDIYERRPDMRKIRIDRGKSINLALSARGIYALREVGLYDEIMKISIPMYGRMIHSIDSSVTFQRYGKDDSEYINAVSRSELNMRLMDLAENYPGVKFHFNQKCEGMNFELRQVFLQNEITMDKYSVICETVIAADGAFSAIRSDMLKNPRFSYSQHYENYGYKELIIPSGKDGSFQLDKNALHIWPRGNFMLIALPNLDGSFTCTLFIAYDESFGGRASFEYLINDVRLIEFFKNQFPDAFHVMPYLSNEFFSNPTGSLATIKCYPWSIDDKFTLLGDASHAIVPFFGQGMNAAFEDCVYLNYYINKYGTDWKIVFDEFQKSRKINTDAIADLAQENFIEMRDLVADPQFQLKKKVEAELHRIYPEKFIPKYSMVTFYRIPYSVALERGRVQDNILNRLTVNKKSFDDIDFEFAKTIVDQTLTDFVF
jgi:kynurenine 3-monooxygenase